MKPINHFIILAVILSISSCSAIKKIPVIQGTSVCEAINGGSLLCHVAEKHNMTLEQIGTIIVLVDYSAIRSGVYSKDTAINVLAQIEAVLEKPVSYAYLKQWLVGTLANKPELIEITDMFPSSPLIMYETDRSILRGFIERHLDSLKDMK